MSLSYQRLKPVEVRDPRTILTNEREYAVLKSGSRTSFKTFTTSSVSQSSVQFSCPPPAGNIIVDRKITMTMPIRLTMTGHYNGALNSNLGIALLNPDTDAPRSFPLNSGIDTLKITINNQAVSIQISDMIHALMNFNTGDDVQMLDYSTTASATDQAQEYYMTHGSTRSPLGLYTSSDDKTIMGRGGFPFTIVSQTVTTALTNTLTSVVDFVVTEPFFLSPLYFGRHNASGFINVTSFDVNVTFLNQAGNRMWSHDCNSPWGGPPPVVSEGTTIDSIVATFNNFTAPPFSYSSQTQPLMNFTYITPQENQYIPYNLPITYPYFDVQRYVTDNNNPVIPGGIWNFNSNNIQLNSIPRRMYVYIRERNNDLLMNANASDAYFQINTPFNLQFQNDSGLMASASLYQLYQLAVDNNCKLSWEQWSGYGMYGTTPIPGSMSTVLPNYTLPNPWGNGYLGSHAPPPDGALNVPGFVGVGTILCFEFATQIGLPSNLAPGSLGQFTLQINGTATNVNPSRNISPSLYIIVVSEGSFTIEGLGKCSTNIGVITQEDILTAKQSPWVSYHDIEDINGGNFLSGLKNFGREILSIAKPVNQFLRDNKVISTIASQIPHPLAQAVGSVASKYGYGGCNNNMGSGVMTGGKHLSRKMLSRRMNM